MRIKKDKNKGREEGIKQGIDDRKEEMKNRKLQRCRKGDGRIEKQKVKKYR